MSDKTNQAGFYVLEKFELTPLYETKKYTSVDLKNTIVNWQFTESINSTFMYGSAIIHESYDMLKDLPVRGEEKLSIQYRDQFKKLHSYEFVVYAVTDIETDRKTNGRILRYTISFCTMQKLDADWQWVRKSYGDSLISDMVQDVFDRYMQGDKEIEIEPTDGEQTLVIPRFRPDEAMQFLARRAYTNKRESSLYYFFENSEKYYFCTYEYLVDKFKPLVASADAAEGNNLKYMFSQLEDNAPAGQEAAKFSVSSLSYLDRSNSIKAMKDGAYKRKITELDYYTRTRTVRTYDYVENIDSHSIIDDLKVINTTDYIDKYMPEEEAPEAIYVTDYNQLGLPQGKDYSLRKYAYYAENFMRKSMIDYYMRTNEVSCSISGNGDIYAGKMIYLDVFTLGETGKGLQEDRERNEQYLVTTVTNVFSGDYHTQLLKITKGGLGKE